MKTYLVLFGGVCSMFIAMGIARFAFTPILPIMQEEFMFSDLFSGAIASANYIGYLVGAIYVRKITKSIHSHKIYLITLLLTVFSIAFMYINSEIMWFIMRFSAGVLTAYMFVLTTEFIIDYLASVNKVYLYGIVYSGMGAGMVLSGFTVPILAKYFNSLEIWLCFGLLLIIPAFFAYKLMPSPHKIIKNNNQNFKEDSNHKSKLMSLNIAYLLAGFGYIITGTFISVIVLRGTGSVTLSSYIWVITGLGAIFITPLWSLASKKIGIANILLTLYILEASSIALPILVPNNIITTICAFIYGGTFLGIVSMVIAYGKVISPTSNTTAILTIYFSVGQLLGPFVAGWLSTIFGGFDIPVLIASALLFTGAILIFIYKGEKENAVY